MLPSFSTSNCKIFGFTLVELSIVLVIIGLIIGGVMLGQDLIQTSKIRSTISQLERYKTGVSAFRTKYGVLPGDMDSATASAFGFAARGNYAGQGDNNGILEGVSANAASSNNGIWQTGETGLFWVDLSQANMIDGSFTRASFTLPGNITSSTSPNLSAFFPEAAIGNSNYFYVYSGGASHDCNNATAGDRKNYYGISAIATLAGGGYTLNPNNTGLSVMQAYNIDQKIDDGYPQFGNVLALRVYGACVYWAMGGGGAVSGTHILGTNIPSSAATAASSTTCYDNGNIVGTQKYSTSTNNGTGINCALTFSF